MDEKTRARALELIEKQEELLILVANDPSLANSLSNQYKSQHRELRSILAKEGKPCFCVEDSLMPWAYSPHSDPASELDLRKAPLGPLFKTEIQAVWTLALYRQNGDEKDIPFIDEFALNLSDEQFTVLNDSLRGELSVEGTSLLRNRSKEHLMPCGGRPKVTVPMYKIEEGAPSGRVVLRVFFETTSNHTIVLLHGYDKGADDSEHREKAETAVACQRRLDLQRQLADPKQRASATASLWSK